jgi:hypothetical protein
LIDLEAIQRRVDAAAPGPWRTAPGYDSPNDEFIAHAREDVPALIAEVRQLRKQIADENEQLRALIAAISADLCTNHQAVMKVAYAQQRIIDAGVVRGDP